MELIGPKKLAMVLDTYKLWHYWAQQSTTAESFIKISRTKQMIATLRSFDSGMSSPCQYQRKYTEEIKDKLDTGVWATSWVAGHYSLLTIHICISQRWQNNQLLLMTFLFTCNIVWNATDCSKLAFARTNLNFCPSNTICMYWPPSKLIMLPTFKVHEQTKYKIMLLRKS